jgi:hypothetical protein
MYYIDPLGSKHLQMLQHLVDLWQDQNATKVFLLQTA